MANRLYAKFKEALLGAGVNLVTGTVKAQLIDLGAYTPAAGDQFLSVIPSAALISSPVALASKTVTGGVFSAASLVFPSVPAGTGTAATVEAIAIYVDTGTASTSPLIALIDTGTGLPFTPAGNNETVAWDPAGIFAL